MLNRRDWFKRAGWLIGAAVVAPAAFAQPKAVEGGFAGLVKHGRAPYPLEVADCYPDATTVRLIGGPRGNTDQTLHGMSQFARYLEFPVTVPGGTLGIARYERVWNQPLALYLSTTC